MMAPEGDREEQGMAVDKREQWLAEFRGAGVDKVRGELALRRWPKEKLVAAREWTEREDAKLWQAARGPGEGAPVKRSRKWMGYVVAAVGLGFAAVRAFRFMRHGF
jgi:hypothetical protein